MTAAAYDPEESLPRRGIVSQTAITIFLGVPMTIALAIALAVYCTFECVKFALSSKLQSKQIKAKAALPGAESDDQKFTAALTKFAEIHGHVEAGPHSTVIDETNSGISAVTNDNKQS